MNKALFLDLDHTLIKPKSGNTFPKNVEDWEFVKGVIKQVKKYYDKGYIIIVVSNQGGIEQGYIKEWEFVSKIDRIKEEILKHSIEIQSVYYCNSMESYYRKPNPGMGYEAALNYKLDLRNSIMVGDMDSDNKFAKNAYIGTYIDIKYFIID